MSEPGDAAELLLLLLLLQQRERHHPLRTAGIRVEMSERKTSFMDHLSPDRVRFLYRPTSPAETPRAHVGLLQKHYVFRENALH